MTPKTERSLMLGFYYDVNIGGVTSKDFYVFTDYILKIKIHALAQYREDGWLIYRSTIQSLTYQE